MKSRRVDRSSVSLEDVALCNLSALAPQERDMAEIVDRNRRIITEFRANAGKVGGQFEGATMVLIHHQGRKSGNKFVSPVLYLADGADPDTIYVFASNGGASTNPEWYHNLLVAHDGVVEVGTQTYSIRVNEITGTVRDAIYNEQASRHPVFAGYAERTQGLRIIPILALTRIAN